MSLYREKMEVPDFFPYLQGTDWPKEGRDRDRRMKSGWERAEDASSCCHLPVVLANATHSE